MRQFVFGALGALIAYGVAWAYRPDVSEKASDAVSAEAPVAQARARSDADARLTLQPPGQSAARDASARKPSAPNEATVRAGDSVHPPHRTVPSGGPNDALPRRAVLGPGQFSPAVQKALQDMANLQEATNNPQHLAERLQQLDPEQANLEQLRDFAEGFVDIPAGSIGVDRLDRDLQRATR